MYNYEGRRERLRVPVRGRKGRERSMRKKRESHKGREKDERAAKASGGRHAEGAERRTINVRTTTSRWMAGQSVGHREQNPHRDARIRD